MGHTYDENGKCTVCGSYFVVLPDEYLGRQIDSLDNAESGTLFEITNETPSAQTEEEILDHYMIIATDGTNVYALNAQEGEGHSFIIKLNTTFEEIKANGFRVKSKDLDSTGYIYTYLYKESNKYPYYSNKLLSGASGSNGKNLYLRMGTSDTQKFPFFDTSGASIKLNIDSSGVLSVIKGDAQLRSYNNFFGAGPVFYPSDQFSSWSYGSANNEIRKDSDGTLFVDASHKVYLNAERGSVNYRKDIWNLGERINQLPSDVLTLYMLKDVGDDNTPIITDEYTRVTNLADLEAGDDIIIVVNDGEKRYALGEYDNGTFEFKDSMTNIVTPDETGVIEANVDYAFTLGDVDQDKDSYRKYTSLYNDAHGLYLYINQDKDGNNFVKLDKKIRPVTIDRLNDQTFKLRGNSSSWYLGVSDDEEIFTSVSYSKAPKLEIYSRQNQDDTDGVDKLEYYASKTAEEPISTQNFGTQASLRKLSDSGKYIFIGWTQDKDKSKYLTLEESANIFNYESGAKDPSITAEAAARLGIIGDANPYKRQVVLKEDLVADSDGVYRLYPVYARHGFDTVVTSDTEDGTPIVGIYNNNIWRVQDEEEDLNDPVKRWLGSVQVEVYLDGKPYGDLKTLYFTYEDDNAVDLNLKFIDNELIEESYDDLADFMDDYQEFPEKSQVDGYTIDGVVATQTGAQGLYYYWNWLMPYGGMLDNVQGGTKIKVYLSSQYQIKYYKDGTELTDDSWKDDNYYYTSATMKALSAVETDYTVTKDNEYEALINRPNSGYFDLKQGESAVFTYQIADADRPTEIKIAKLPEGKLKQTKWEIRAEDGTFLAEQNPESTMQIVAKEGTPGYTGNSWKNILNSESDTDTADNTESAYIYHLYVDTDNTPDRPVTRTYTLKYESNGGTQYDDEKYTANTVVSLSKVPTREGYRFTGWYADDALTKSITSITMTADATVYAGWRASTVPNMLNGDDHFSYIIGYPDGTVRPTANVSRGEVAMIFFRLLKAEIRDANLTADNTFTDVNEGDVCNKAVSTLNKLGIMKGRTATTFDPNAPITRAEFAAVCARFDTGVTLGASDFTDIDDCWAKDEIERAVALGWIRGYGDNTFRPNQNIIRAEAVTMINRVLCRIPENEDDLLDGMLVWPDNNLGDVHYFALQEATNSHEYKSKGEVYETWTKLTENPDWTIYQ